MTAQTTAQTSVIGAAVLAHVDSLTADMHAQEAFSRSARAFAEALKISKAHKIAEAVKVATDGLTLAHGATAYVSDTSVTAHGLTGHVLSLPTGAEGAEALPVSARDLQTKILKAMKGKEADGLGQKVTKATLKRARSQGHAWDLLLSLFDAVDAKRAEAKAEQEAAEAEAAEAIAEAEAVEAVKIPATLSDVVRILAAMVDAGEILTDDDAATLARILGAR